MEDKIGLSIEERRKAVVKLVQERSPEGHVFKSIPFENDDVPNYLKGLRKFLERSEKSRQIIG